MQKPGSFWVIIIVLWSSGKSCRGLHITEKTLSYNCFSKKAPLVIG